MCEENTDLLFFLQLIKFLKAPSHFVHSSILCFNPKQDEAKYRLWQKEQLKHLTTKPSSVTPIIVFYATVPHKQVDKSQIWKKKKLSTGDNSITECHLLNFMLQPR